MRRHRFKGVPRAERAWDRWHQGSRLSQDTLHGIGGDANALVVEDVGQTLLAEAGVVGLGTQHRVNDTLRFSGAVDTGRAIQGCQTPLLGLMAVFVKGGTGDAEKTGDQSHAKDMRSDQSQDVAFEVIQSGLNLYWQ